MNFLEKQTIRLLEVAREHGKIRSIVAAILVSLLLVLLGKFIYELMPRHYTLTVAGGNILSQRQYLIKLLQDEAKANQVSLKIVKVPGSIAALEEVDEGKIDLALVQGGMGNKFLNVTHVATISPELIHFIVKPGINDVKDFRGAVINMGEPNEGTRILAHQIFNYLNLVADTDYAEKNFTDEELIGMHPSKLPDVIVSASYAPSDVADFLVKKRGYHLVEMSFPPSLAKRLGWVADAKILGYMYSIVPPIPPKDIQVVGVYLHLVANKNVKPEAIAALLSTLYGLHVQSRFGNPIPESDLLFPSGYPISKGTELYLARKQPIIDDAFMDKAKAIAGFLMTLVSILAVIWRWFKSHREDAINYLAEEQHRDL
jgi:hypothetical protein